MLTQLCFVDHVINIALYEVPENFTHVRRKTGKRPVIFLQKKKEEKKASVTMTLMLSAAKSVW